MDLGMIESAKSDPKGADSSLHIFLYFTYIYLQLMQ